MKEENMQFKNATPEEIELHEAAEAHIEALKFEGFVLKGALVFYFVGFPLSLLGEGMVGAVGFALFFAGIATMIYHYFVHRDTEKKRQAAQKLAEAYMRKKALPFYQELLEKFADENGIHIHLNDNGTITITDKRNEIKE